MAFGSETEKLNMLQRLQNDLLAVRKPLLMEIYNPDRLKGWSEPGYDCPDEEYTYGDYQKDCTRTNYNFISYLADVFTPVYESYDFSVKYTEVSGIKNYKPEPNALLVLLQNSGLEQKYIDDLKKWVKIWNMQYQLKEKHPSYGSGYLSQYIEKACIPIVYDYADTVFQRNFAGTHSTDIPTLAKQRSDFMIEYTDIVHTRTVKVLKSITKTL